MTFCFYANVYFTIASIYCCSDRVNEREMVTREMTEYATVEEKMDLRPIQENESMDIDEPLDNAINESHKSCIVATDQNTEVVNDYKPALHKDRTAFDNDTAIPKALKNYAQKEIDVIQYLTLMRSIHIAKLDKGVKYHKSQNNQPHKEDGNRTGQDLTKVNSMCTVKEKQHDKFRKVILQSQKNSAYEHLAPTVSSSMTEANEIKKQLYLLENTKVCANFAKSDAFKPKSNLVEADCLAPEHLKQTCVSIVADNDLSKTAQKGLANQRSFPEDPKESIRVIQRTTFCKRNPEKRKNTNTISSTTLTRQKGNCNNHSASKIQKPDKTSLDPKVHNLNVLESESRMKTCFDCTSSLKSQTESQDRYYQMTDENKALLDEVKLAEANNLPDIQMFSFDLIYAEYEKDITDRLSDRITRTQGYSESVLPYEHNPKMKSVLTVLSKLNHCAKEGEIIATIAKHAEKKNITIVSSRFHIPIMFTSSFYEVRKFISNGLKHSKLCNDSLLNVELDGKKILEKGTDYGTKLKCFVKFIETNILCKLEFSDFYVIRPELWVINLCMPEVSLYLGWRVTAIIEEIKKEVHIEHDFSTEIDILMSILKLFISSIKDTSDGDLINKCYTVVDGYRKFISQLLIKHYKGTTQYYLYHHGLIHFTSQAHIQQTRRNADIMNMMAFAARSEVFNNHFSRDSDDSQEFILKMSYNNDIRRQIINNKTLANHTVRTLQALVVYFKKMKGTEPKMTDNLSFIIPYRKPIIFIPCVRQEQVINVYIMSDAQLFQYYHEQILLSIME